ncbi:hypothetical protein [Streptomyces fradiae]|uniref:hypothetical protein n=1 Tax=Streptomyces fradiae TaxID=1906 RepID=UPI0036924095
MRWARPTATRLISQPASITREVSSIWRRPVSWRISPRPTASSVADARATAAVNRPSAAAVYKASAKVTMSGPSYELVG